MPDKFEQYYKYLKANGADVAPDFNSFKNTLSDSNKASKYYSYLKENQFDVPETFDSFANTFGLKKKAGDLLSSGIPSRLPNEPNFLQQGQKVASGEIFTDISKSVPKTTLKDAAIKDKQNNNSYLGAMWNNVVASAERLAGGAARLAQKFDTSPVSMIQETVDKAASSVTGINYEAQREKEIADKVKSFIGKARSSASSREYEQGLAEGFDVTNGIGLDDLQGLVAVLPSMLVDMGAGAATGGSSFAIQGYDDALSTLDNIPEAKYMSETTRTAFGFGGAIVAGVLEKLGMDNILKSGTVTKYVTSKILKETAGELAKKGVKVTAEQFEKAVANKATQMLTKTALKNTVKAGAKSALAEGATEATQEGAMDLMKLAANQLEGNEIFDEKDLKNTAASRYLNAAAMGGIFGGAGGVIMSRTKNVQQHIEDEVKNAKTQEDIAAIINDIDENLKDGTISENDAEVFKSIVDENINKPSTLEIENEKETKLSDIDEFINSLDKNDRLYNDKLNELNKEKNEIISYYDDLSKKSQKDEETSFDDGKVPTEEEMITEEVTPTGVKIGDAVQWTSQGADQFAEPRKIKSISEDGEYAFVEGSDTGIPVKELSVTEVTPTEVKVTEEVKPTTQEIKKINEVHKNLFNQYSKKQAELIKEGLRGSDLENNPELVGIKNQMNKIEDYFKDTQVPQPAKKIEPTKVKEEVKIEEPVSTQKVKIPGTKQSKPIPLSDFTLGKEGERSFTKRVKKDEGGVSGVEPLNQFKLNQGMDSYGNPYPRVHVILDDADAEKYQAFFSAGGKKVPKNSEFRDEINKIAKANRSKTDEVVLDFRKSETDALTKKAAVKPTEAKTEPKEKKKIIKTKSDIVADDLLSYLGIVPSEVKFSKTTGKPEIIKSPETIQGEVIDQMNKMNLFNQGVDLDLSSTTKEKVDIDELNSRLDYPLKKVDFKDFEGYPFIFTISDQLRTGDVVNPNTGQTVTDLKGGIGFNGTKGHENMAWANTTKEEAEKLYNNAEDVYNSNKALFEKAWANGDLPSGQIPMAVVKMAESSILSNEAVFRTGIQNVETLPKKNRKQAVSNIAESLKYKVKTESDALKRGTDANGKRYAPLTMAAKEKVVSQSKNILKIIQEKKYTDIVDLLKDIKIFSLPERAIIVNQFFYGSPTAAGAKEIDINRSKPKTKVSVDLIGNADPSLIHIGKITDLLTEPSTKNVPSTHITGVVGVKVANKVGKTWAKAGGPVETTHPNYPYGVEGGSIGVLEQPVHMKDAFGEAYGSVLSIITKNEAKKASISEGASFSQGLPVQAGLSNKVFSPAIAKGRLDAVDKLSGFLRQAFPTTTFFTTQEAWQSALEQPNVKKHLKDGDVIYAFTTDGNVYINPDLKTTKAALHETGHIWAGFVKENNAPLYNKGLSLVDGTNELKKAIEQYGDTPLAREEALMELMSSKGDTIVNASQKAKFKEWLLSLYKYISENFKSLMKLSPKEVENITLDKFLEGMLADILSGKELTTNKIKGETKFSKESQEDSIRKFIEIQRGKGLTDNEIRAGILKVADQIGLDKSKINDLFKKETKTEIVNYKDLNRIEKRQIINSKFDELIKELKIEKICPT
jgi:hypothetical protein